MFNSIEYELDEELANYSLPPSFDPTKQPPPPPPPLQLQAENVAITSQENDSVDPNGLTYEPYEKPESLWQLIRSVVNENELDVIKREISDSLVDTNTELHAEIDSLLDIWREYRNETAQLLSKKSSHLTSHDPAIASSSSSSISSLPEPPNARTTLKKEIRLFVQQIRDQYNDYNDAKLKQMLKDQNHNLNVINYALDDVTSDTKKKLKKTNEDAALSETAFLVGRPTSVVIGEHLRGSETPLVPVSDSECWPTTGRTIAPSTSRSSARHSSLSRPRSTLHYARSSSVATTRGRETATRLATAAAADDEQQQQQHQQAALSIDEDKLDYVHIDEIAEHLRSLFTNENELLARDIELLYDCIDRESAFRYVSSSSNSHGAFVDTLPSLSELKEERKRLETHILSSTARNQMRISKLPASVSTANNNRSIGGRSPLNRSPLTSASSSNASSAVSSRRETFSQTTTSAIKKNAPAVAAIKNIQLEAKNKFMLATHSPLAAVEKKRQQLNNQLHQIQQQQQHQQHQQEQLLNPTSSRSSRSSSSSSTTPTTRTSRSSSRQTSAAQKFRQMVLDSREN